MVKKPFTSAWLFLAATCLASVAVFVPVLASGVGMASPLNAALVALACFIPSLMGILFTYMTRDAVGRRDFWRRAFCWPRGRTKMALAGLLLLPAIVLSSFLISSWIDGRELTLPYAQELLTNWKSLLLFLFVEITFGALSEELGWRGFALDGLQSRWSALASSLVLGFIWALWHSPAFLTPGTIQYAMGGIFSWSYVTFIISVTLGSVLITWIYNNTGRSILVAGFLMHFAQNASLVLLGGIFDRFSVPPAYWTVAMVETALAAALVVRFYGWRSMTRQAS